MKLLLAALLLGASTGDKGPSQEGYGGEQQFYTPQVKYAGPIVYSGEKPPIIHFPPPPKVTDPTLESISFNKPSAVLL